MAASLPGDHPHPSYWLHDAVAANDIKRVKLLLKDQFFGGPNKQVAMPNGRLFTCLEVALLQQNKEAYQLLLDAGADPKLVHTETVEKHKLPEEPVEPKSCRFVEILVQLKADVSGVADLGLGTSWLHEVIRHDMGIPLAKALVEQGAPLDAGDGKGNTALHFAMERENLAMARALLEIGANMNLYNKAGFTSFGCACMAAEVDMVNKMVSLGADVNGGSNAPLFLACKGSLVKHHYKTPDATPEQQQAWRAQWAADKEKRRVYSDIARQLLAHGADPGASDGDGNFPLMAAAESGFTEILPDLAAADIYRATLAAIAATELAAVNKDEGGEDMSQAEKDKLAAAAKAARAAAAGSGIGSRYIPPEGRAQQETGF